MAAEIDPALQDLLRGNVNRPIDVEIEFKEMPPAGQLEALGLESRGNLAWGSLPVAKIHMIASLPQVRAIRKSTHPARPIPPRSPASKIGPRLAVDLSDPERQEFLVTVMFTGSPPPELDAPGMMRYPNMVIGRLNRKQIDELTHRDDVTLIEAQGEMQFH